MGDGDRAWAAPLDRLLRLPGVTDVMVHQPRRAWIDRGAGLEACEVDLPDPAAVRALAVRLASLGGRRLDDAAPITDARLPDGTRLHAALPPIAQGCAAISLRTVRQEALGMDDLVASGMLHGGIVTLLRRLVEVRASLLVTGATGSGKTTMLASLLSLVPVDQRLVIIEEAGELSPNHPNVVRLVERQPNIEGAGGIGLPRLVREALRMRPDRVVLGECRGAELRDVLAAFNTGHRGGFTTLHANAPRDVPVRLTTLGALAGMPGRAVELQALAAFEVVLHVERSRSGRRLSELAVPRLGERGLVVETALTVGTSGLTAGPGWAQLHRLVGGGQA